MTKLREQLIVATDQEELNPNQTAKEVVLFDTEGAPFQFTGGGPDSGLGSTGYYSTPKTTEAASGDTVTLSQPEFSVGTEYLSYDDEDDTRGIITEAGEYHFQGSVKVTTPPLGDQVTYQIAVVDDDNDFSAFLEEVVQDPSGGAQLSISAHLGVGSLFYITALQESGDPIEFDFTNLVVTKTGVPEVEGGASVSTFNDLSVDDLTNLLQQNNNPYDLASCKIKYALADTTDEMYKTIVFECEMWFFDGEIGQIEFNLENLLSRLPELNVDYLPPKGVKALVQGTVGGVECFGFIAMPGNPDSGSGVLLDMTGTPITSALVVADNISFNASWLVRNDD